MNNDFEEPPDIGEMKKMSKKKLENWGLQIKIWVLETKLEILETRLKILENKLKKST